MLGGRHIHTVTEDQHGLQDQSCLEEALVWYQAKNITTAIQHLQAINEYSDSATAITIKQQSKYTQSLWQLQEAVFDEWFDQVHRGGHVHPTNQHQSCEH